MRLLSAGQQVKAVAIRSHQALKQRTVHAMQILQRVDQRELRPQIQLQRGMADGSEIHQHDAPVSFLQGDGSIYRSCGRARSTLGVQKREDASFARTALRPAQGRREASESLDQGLSARGM